MLRAHRPDALAVRPHHGDVVLVGRLEQRAGEFLAALDSSKPALKTMALRMPLAPHSAMIPGTVCAGVITSATSGVWQLAQTL